ncbi:MAG: type II toxin-antitoxin system Y4mF family antitoxin [Rhodobacteraceae bacterium]|nr:type II toxin-antitoxin system Y4mF family antitoxin [Paracoccaceae bacterium]
MSNDRVRKLGKIVKAIRKDQGLTQEQLAATTGVGIRFVRELENGKESCHIGKALATISMLGIDIHLNGIKL